MKIGVFDSGVGGKSVAKAVTKAFPEHEVVYVEDHKNVPYGLKTPEELFVLVAPILKSLADDGCQIIVVACNTVTTTIITKLREQIAVPLIGIEPMVKAAAALTKSGVITICATPTTLQSERYTQLKKMHASHIQVLEPDCSRWSEMIEQGNIEWAIIHDVVEESIQRGADVIVMGCTHYHWIADEVAEITKDRAVVLQPEPMVMDELRQVIARLG